MPLYRLGENGHVYYSATPVTSLTYTLPTTTVDNIKDVKVGAKNDTPESTVRGNGGQKSFANSLTELGIQLQIRVPGPAQTDAAYTALLAAFTGKTEIAAYALNDLKSVVGADGPAGNFIVASFDRDEGNGNVQWISVELKPSSFNSWYTVAS